LVVDLGQIVRDFALGMEAVDHRSPQAASHRDATRLYRPGIGPFGEDTAVAMTVAEMKAANADAYASAGRRRYCRFDTFQGSACAARHDGHMDGGKPSR
jgi:hypothetical protein